MTPVIIDCDPGHDDAIALLLALASPEIDLLGVTTVHGNQTIDKTTDNALRILALVGREDVPVAMGADRPLEREPHVAAHVHGESGLDGPELPPRASEPIAQHAVDFLVEHVTAGDRARAGRAVDERRARARPGHAAGSDRADGRCHRGGQHDPGGGVQHLGRSRGRAAGLPLGHRRDDGRARRHARRASDACVGGAVQAVRPRRHVRRRARRVLQAVPRPDLRLGRRSDSRRGRDGTRPTPGPR